MIFEKHARLGGLYMHHLVRVPRSWLKLQR